MHRICFFEQIKLRHSILNHGILNECLTKIILKDLNETRAQDYGKEKVEEIIAKTEYADKLQGFFMSYLNLNDYYITAPELELSHGYCDFFLLPDHTHYASKHSYILELKVLSKKEFDEPVKDTLDENGTPITKAERQWREAVEQITHYAAAPRVEALRQGTTLHRIIMQFKGWELARMEEV